MSFEGFEESYRRRIRRKRLVIAIMLVLAAVAALLEIALGPYEIGFGEAYRVFFDHLTGVPIDNATDEYVVWEKNAPRGLAVFFVGAGLGICGAAMQSALRNPLADPYMTGISSGANFGIALASVAGVVILPFLTGSMGSIGNAFVLSLIPAAVIMLASGFRSSSNPTTMILVGIAVMYVFSSFTTMLNLAASSETFASVYMWGLGTLGSVSWDTLPYLICATLAGVALLSMLSARLNILSCDENLAVSSGIRPKTVRLVTIAVVSLVTATLVCFTGTIGFVGLVAPHVMRIFIDSDNRYLLPASAACGAFVLAAADCLAVEITATGLPVGVITSIIGGPLFIYILVTQHRKVWNRGRYHEIGSRRHHVRIRRRGCSEGCDVLGGIPSVRVCPRTQRRGEVHANTLHRPHPDA